MKKFAPKSLLALAALGSAFSIEAYAGFTWTSPEVPRSIYITQGCSTDDGDSIAVVTLSQSNKQYAFRMSEPGAGLIYQNIKEAIIYNKRAALNYNNSASDVRYNVVRYSNCGYTNPMIKITGSSLMHD